MKTQSRWIVSKDGQPCTYAPIAFNYGFNFKRGVLQKCGPDEVPRIFSRKSAARHAIDRTLKLSAKIKGSMLDEWPRMSQVIEPGAWAIESVVKYNKRVVRAA